MALVKASLGAKRSDQLPQMALIYGRGLEGAAVRSSMRVDKVAKVVLLVRVLVGKGGLRGERWYLIVTPTSL